MEIVMWHASRQVPSWLIFDVGQTMKRVALLVLGGVALTTIIVVWVVFPKASNERLDGFSELEESLKASLTRLRGASDKPLEADPSHATYVLALAQRLADVGDSRQKRLATDATKEAGRILFGEESGAGLAANSTRGAEEVVPFPGALPEQRFKPLPLQSYVGKYAGTIAGRPVSFVVSVTNRALLGIRIVGLGVQPTLEFVEERPQSFFRPDTKTVFVFANPTGGGFRTLYFLQNGVQERAENISPTVAESR